VLATGSSGEDARTTLTSLAEAKRARLDGLEDA